jgi:hypothetical protein
MQSPDAPDTASATGQPKSDGHHRVHRDGLSLREVRPLEQPQGAKEMTPEPPGKFTERVILRIYPPMNVKLFAAICKAASRRNKGDPIAYVRNAEDCYEVFILEPK